MLNLLFILQNAMLIFSLESSIKLHKLKDRRKRGNERSLYVVCWYAVMSHFSSTFTCWDHSTPKIQNHPHVVELYYTMVKNGLNCLFAFVADLIQFLLALAPLLSPAVFMVISAMAQFYSRMQTIFSFSFCIALSLFPPRKKDMLHKWGKSLSDKISQNLCFLWRSLLSPALHHAVE